MQDFMTELKEQCIWFHWIWDKDKDGRLTKVPKASAGGPTGTSPDWSHTWATFAEAEATLSARKADGLAFKIPDGYFFLDADDYSLDDPFIQMLLNRFNSYTERSVSGGGIHIYGKCDPTKIPFETDKKGRKRLDGAYYVKHPTNHLELYIGGLTNRFAVYTEDVVWKEPLRECTDAVLTTLDSNMRREITPKGNPSVIAPEAIFRTIPLSSRHRDPSKVKNSKLCGTVKFPKANLEAKLIWLYAPSSHFGAVAIWSRWTGFSGNPVLCVRNGKSVMITVLQPLKKR